MSGFTCRDCGKRIPGLRAQHCPVCHETFGGTQIGDRHRIGPYEPKGMRHCRDHEEMTALGSWLDEKGVWHEKHDQRVHGDPQTRGAA